MTMDRGLWGHTDSRREQQLGNRSVPILQQNQTLENALFNQGREFRFLQSDQLPNNNTPSSSTVTNEEHYSPEDCDFSDAVLSYINQILMEEDMEDKTCMLQDSLDLQAAEKSFYEALGQKYPPSPAQNHPSLMINENDGVMGNNNDFPRNYSDFHSNNYGNFNGTFILQSLSQNPNEFPSQIIRGNGISESSYSSSSSVVSGLEGRVDSPSTNSIVQVPDLNTESQSISQFKKGVEEASRFLPNGNKLLADLGVSNLSREESKARTREMSAKVEKDEEYDFLGGSKVRKQSNKGEEDDDEEEKSSKQAAVYTEPTLHSVMFDLMLLHVDGEGKNHYMARREALQNKTIKAVMPNGQAAKASNTSKGRGKKQNGRKSVVDLRTLLVLCAQAAAADDHKNAQELIKQIRQHSNPFGDGNQRLAHVFADGLDARLAGTGRQIYKGLISKKRSAADLLKAYHLYLAACPFKKISNFSSNVTIRTASGNSTRIHIIDFGILYGFQWPTFIQRLAFRTGGKPPKIRMTGIDFPQPGFRPAEVIEETGRRLADYAKAFNVPFEYVAIAKKWESIQLEELKIDRDEFLVVNCLYRAKNLLDESVTVESPRNAFLNLVRKINPDVFIHGIVNGAFNAPFFVTRFREALFYYSSLFDMLETIVPREDGERMLIEKEIFGREALNVIACEGCERSERPETYKQWQARILRAGFTQIPFCRDIVERAIDERTVMEAVTAILGVELPVGILLQGKKVQDDNKTLIQTGISQGDKYHRLGFMLEPRHTKITPPSYSEDPPFRATSSHQDISRHKFKQLLVYIFVVYFANPFAHGIIGFPLSENLILLVTIPCQSAMPAIYMDALAVISFSHKPRNPDFVQRRIWRPFSVSEVEALVQAVEKLGTGRWRDVKQCAFDNAKHRTCVDLKDKWKTLVHTARISPQQRRGEHVPQELLDRVLAAHAYWPQQQCKHPVKPL